MLLTCIPAFAQGAGAAPKPLQVSSTYRLQPGDEVMVSVLPRPEYGSGGIISPDGTLSLKNVGPVKAAGMTVSELEAYVAQALLKQLKRPKVTITLAKLAVLPRVTVTGAVVKPGPVELQEGLRVRKALELAGGPNKDADLTRVLVTHKDLTRAVVDLSTEERAANAAQNLLLQELDSIEIPLRPNKVTVVGAVVKPGPIDLEEGLRARKAIELAGGALKDADLTRVVVVHRDLSKAVVDLSTAEKVTDATQNLRLLDADSIEVPLLPNKVTVAGGVVKPGAVDLETGLRVRKAIELVGGPMKDADLSQVAIVHKDLTRSIVNLSNRENVLDPAQNLLLKDGDSVDVPLTYEPGYASISGAVIKAAKYELRTGMTLEDLIVAAGKLAPLADIEHIQFSRKGKPSETINLAERQKQGLAGKILIQPGDEVSIPEMKDVLFLVGAIPNPGPQPLKPGQTVRDFFTGDNLLGQSKNLTPDTQLTTPNPGSASALDGRQVDLAHAQVIRHGQQAVTVNLKEVLKKPNAKQNMVLQTGDVIYLPPKDPNKKKSGLTGLMEMFQPLYYLFALVP
jgi:protein involved in polysaccharide export with SLBB domain